MIVGDLKNLRKTFKLLIVSRVYRNFWPVPQQWSMRTSRAFPVAAPRIWNSLPEHIIMAATLQSFKKHLKTFLLQRSYLSLIHI